MSKTDADKFNNYLNDNPTQKFKISVEGIGRKIPFSEQLIIIQKLKLFPQLKDENVNLKTPDVIFKFIENAEDGLMYFGR